MSHPSWQVEVKDKDFETGASVGRFKSDTEVRAFDADGGEHRFIPECHVGNTIAFYPFVNNHNSSLRTVFLK